LNAQKHRHSSIVLAVGLWTAGLFGWAALTSAASAQELIGSSFSLIYRGPADSAAKGQPSFSLTNRGLVLNMPQAPAPRGELTLIEPASGKALARARYDQQLRGFFFQMPTTFPLPSTPVCLAIRGIDGKTLPLRPESENDDGYEFEHTPWESTMRGRQDVQTLEAEVARLDKQLGDDAASRDALLKQFGIAATETPPVCQLGQPQPVPPRPAWAADSGMVVSSANTHCANSLIRRLKLVGGDIGNAAERLAKMVMANKTMSDKVLPSPAEPLVTIELSNDLLTLLQQGLARGRDTLQYEQGFEGLRKTHSLCASRLEKFSEEEAARWESEKLAALNFPMSSKARCEADQQRLIMLNDRAIKATTYRAALQSRISNAKSRANVRSEQLALDGGACAKR
jgi:hypothetical protein